MPHQKQSRVMANKYTETTGFRWYKVGTFLSLCGVAAWRIAELSSQTICVGWWLLSTQRWDRVTEPTCL